MQDKRLKQIEVRNRALDCWLRGRGPFGEPTRPTLSTVEIVHLLAEVGAWGSMVPVDATPVQRGRFAADFEQAAAAAGLAVPTATTNLFTLAEF